MIVVVALSAGSIGSNLLATEPLTSNDIARVWDANADLWIRLVDDRKDLYKEFVTSPSFMKLLPDVSGLRGIDIGCGHGYSTRPLANRGANMTGVDVSPALLAEAQRRNDLDNVSIEYIRADATDLPFGDATFDFATAFLSLMDIPNAEQAIHEAARVIKEDGFFQFTILHPCFSFYAGEWVEDSTTGKRSFLYHDYFDAPEEWPASWCFEGVSDKEIEEHGLFHFIHYRHSLTWWLNELAAAGFVIEVVDEPHPAMDVLKDHPAISGSRTIPYFLTIRCRKQPLAGGQPPSLDRPQEITVRDAIRYRMQ